MGSALAHEAEAVNAVKRANRFTVVVGNPPYSVSSWNTGEWITNLVDVYKKTVRLEESQIQSLSNDYIKFLRLGEWLIQGSGIGVLGLITGHGYLHGTQPRDMRRHLSTTFARCYCLDLHGSIRLDGTDDEEDEPVFQIMTGVAIIVALRLAGSSGQGRTTLSSLTGRLDCKFEFLDRETAAQLANRTPLHSPSAPYFQFGHHGATAELEAEYHSYPDLPTIFGTGNRKADKESRWATGFATQQDDLAISFDRAEMRAKMEALAQSKSSEELRQKYRLCTTDQWDYEKAREFAQQGQWERYLTQVTYRPFDRRWTVFHKHILTILRKQVMSRLTAR
jgi:predicted helicase